jgi:hypothetical protein
MNNDPTSASKLVEAAAQVLWREDMGQQIPWTQAPEGRKAVYRNRARSQLALISSVLEEQGWVMVPRALSKEEAVEVSVHATLLAPKDIRQGDRFALDPGVVQIILDHVIDQTNTFKQEAAAS